MRYRINEPWVPACMQKAEPEGPLVPYLRPFGQSLIEQGYFGCYLRRHVMLAMYFSQWLKKKGFRSRCVTSKDSSNYLKYRHRQRQARPGDSVAISHLLAFLRSQRVISIDVTACMTYATDLPPPPWSTGTDPIKILNSAYRY
jgi:hypothetical protein